MARPAAVTKNKNVSDRGGGKRKTQRKGEDRWKKAAKTKETVLWDHAPRYGRGNGVNEPHTKASWGNQHGRFLIWDQGEYRGGGGRRKTRKETSNKKTQEVLNRCGIIAKQGASFAGEGG